jgi:uncharacterized protein
MHIFYLFEAVCKLEIENPRPEQSQNNHLPEDISPNSPQEIETPVIPVESKLPQNGVWPFWPTIGFSAAILAVYIFSQTLVTIIFAGIYIVQQFSINTNLDLITTIQSLTTNGLLLSLATIFSALAGSAAIVLFVKLRKGITLTEYLGLKLFNKKTLIIIIALAIVLIIISSVIDRFFPQSKNTDFTIDAYNSAVWPGLLAIAVVIFAPLFEEGFFRGFLFAGLKQTRLGGPGTILITAAGWAALHIQYDVYGIISIFVLGIVLGIVRLKTDSLWSVLILHALWNLAAIAATALYVNGIGT